MTNFKKTTATATLIALMAAAPVSAFAGSDSNDEGDLTQSSSPQLSVDADPDEYAVDEDTKGSLEDSAKADQGDEEDADVVEDANGSLIDGDARSDG